MIIVGDSNMHVDNENNRWNASFYLLLDWTQTHPSKLCETQHLRHSQNFWPQLDIRHV